MPVIDLDHVQIAAPKGCEVQARKFFGTLLGLPEIEKPEPLRTRGGCWFQVGPRQLHIGVDDPFLPSRKAHPAFAVQEIDQLFAKLQAAGTKCAWDTVLTSPRRFYAEDPWCNRLEFTETSH